MKFQCCFVVINLLFFQYACLSNVLLSGVQLQTVTFSFLSPGLFYRWLCHDQILAPLDQHRWVAKMCMLYKVCWNSMNCLYGALASASHRVIPARAGYRFELDFSEAEHRNWRDASCLLAFVHGIFYPMLCLESEFLGGSKGAVNLWLLSWAVFFLSM